MKLLARLGLWKGGLGATSREMAHRRLSAVFLAVGRFMPKGRPVIYADHVATMGKNH